MRGFLWFMAGVTLILVIGFAAGVFPNPGPRLEEVRTGLLERSPTSSGRQDQTTSSGTTSDSGATATPPATASPSQLELKRYLLDLINQDRAQHSIDPVALDFNPAAQQHADDLMANGYLSHWGLDGLKPYMRYTLSGGTEYVSENVSGLPYPLEDARRYRERPARQIIQEAEEGFMESPGHRRNILDPWHRKVSLGIACNNVTCYVVQHFQGDYVAFGRTPEITDGALRAAVTLSHGFTPAQVHIWYDQPPAPLTRGQVGAAFSYGVGQKPAAFIRKPAPAGSFYLEDETEYAWQSGVDPYKVDPASPPPTPTCTDSVCEAPTNARTVQSETAVVPLVTADRWAEAEGTLSFDVDIGGALEEHGPGVYTAVIWGEREGERVPLTNYSIFYRTAP